MNNKPKTSLKLSFLGFLLFFSFSSFEGFSQVSSDIVLSWNINVGCQLAALPKENEIFAEDIQPTTCIKVCEDSYVTYKITGTLGANPNVQWLAIGGATASQINTTNTSSIIVHWGSAGNASISYTMNTPSGGIVTKTLCIIIENKPLANFSVYTLNGDPNGTRPEIYACVDQPINFHDLSIANGGTQLETVYWDFGDGDTFSGSSQDLTHIYHEINQYHVTLTVTNACGCTSTITKIVNIKDIGGFEISCPGVVCDGTIQTYSLPSLETGVCENYNYTAIGGEIVNNPNDGSVTVAWNQVDESGFGQLIFTPTSCNLQCLYPTTIQIPVIQTVGTIHGNNIMCLGSQEKFTLPQWPTTDFQWEVLGNTANSQALLINTDQRNEIIVVPAHQGTITLICTYQNTFLHCGGSATITIHVKIPEPITGLTNLCINSIGQYHTVSQNNVDWTLTKNNVVVSSASNTSVFNYPFTIAGNYSLTVSGANVCSNQTTSITINPIPVAPLVTNIVTPTALICPSAPYTYSVLVPNPAMDYNWSITGGTIVGSSTDNDFTVNFNQTGPYSIQLTQHPKGQLSCVSPPAVITPSVFQILADISTIQTPATVPTSLNTCANIESNYYAVNQNTGGLYTQGETYTWSIFPSSAGSITFGQGTNAVKVLWNNTTALTTAHLIVQISKCTRTVIFDKTVTITPLPELTLSAQSQCSGFPVQFTLASANQVPFATGTLINWDFGNPNGFGNTIQQPIPNSTLSTTISHSYYTDPSGPVYFTVTATIINPNGCIGTIKKTVTITVTPGPLASASIISETNTFCNLADIDAVFQAATSTGASIQWFKYPNTPVGTGATLNVTPNAPFGPGKYYFIATLNGCVTYSNSVYVFVVNCGPVETCTLNPNPEVTVFQPACTTQAVPSICPNCGNLNLLATASITPLSSNWTIVGPDDNANVSNQTGSSLYAYNTPITAAGTYHVIYRAQYLCDGNIANKIAETDVIVPYITAFTTAVTCNGSNNYTITLNDTSSFITSVSDRHYFYYYSTTGVNGPWIAINSTSTTLPTASFNTTSAGSYLIKLNIYGTMAGETTPSTTCQKISDPIVISSPPANQQIFVQNNNCYNSAISFNPSNFVPGESYLWTFDTASTNTPLATSTLQNTSRVFDPTADGSAHVVRVTLTITNKYGCVRELERIFTIPARCYFGDIATSTPAICKNGSMELHYQPNSTHPDNCTVAQYLWMEGNNPIPSNVLAVNPTTSSSVTLTGVNGTPFYWVKLLSSSNASSSCNYNTPTRITPNLLPLPTIQISAPSIVCQGSDNVATVTTNTTNFHWFVDNVQQATTANTLPLNWFEIGTHVLSVTASTGGVNPCFKTVQQNFTVQASPQQPTVSYEIANCQSYKINLIASPPANGTGTLIWSSGTIGNPTTVYSGGPYMVTYNDGSGCTSRNQLDVPYSLDRYLWEFPTGCYSMCDENVGTIIGPIVDIPAWQYFINNQVATEGQDTVLPFNPTESGVYNLSLISGCPEHSGNMNLTVERCRACAFKDVGIKELQCNFNGIYYYTMILSITNSNLVDINTTITVPGDEVVISPINFVVIPGTDSYVFNVIPLNGFSSGPVNFNLSGTDARGNACNYSFVVTFQKCDRPRKVIGPNSKIDTGLSNIALFPNPAKEIVNIKYNSQSPNMQIELYDVTGKLLSTFKPQNTEGTIAMPIHSFAKGIYIIVLKEDEQPVLQKKLIIY